MGNVFVASMTCAPLESPCPRSACKLHPDPSNSRAVGDQAGAIVRAMLSSILQGSPQYTCRFTEPRSLTNSSYSIAIGLFGNRPSQTPLTSSSTPSQLQPRVFAIRRSGP